MVQALNEIEIPSEARFVAELEDPATSHQRRATIGDLLDHLGDPRLGVGLRADGTPDIVWCDVPGGQLQVEATNRPIEVKPFFMAKYLVTHTQYKAFLNDPQGYDHDGNWMGLERPAEPGQQSRLGGNHPAETVSWYEAAAFCRWLSRRLGFEIRLPYESEWQQAATSGDGANTYPWGRSWKEGYANTCESHLGRTTAVGVYPQGASKEGVMDLAGNVWEWCANLFDHPNSRSGKNTELRVLRGGSCHSRREFARAPYRDVYFAGPDFRLNHLGFRVVCVSPSVMDR
jgi:formylglycine-generating enzyme required for sulfatase activity